MRSLTSLTLMRFSGSARVWMLAQMAFARPALRHTPGLRFWKLLGMGDGFSLRPNLSGYGLLAVWALPEYADAFFSAAPIMRHFRSRADECWTIRMVAIQSRGAWSGMNPFEPDAAPDDGPLAILTRATIRWRCLAAFWSSVPGTNHALIGAPGLVLSVGIGEAPVVRQATFSLWRSEADMRAFAYRTSAHAQVIRRTRDERWYAEDLFARFKPLMTEGTWYGEDPLARARATAVA
ncbi:MAG: hypothetical protein NZM18_13390 [Thermoflexales bacterium]|nr:hypothetical protein [Thermoflexales bacterium]MDW8350960.1 spheroidene monooxygenase [Anaerolineae bacterium]